MANKTVLVTGATGFLGRQVVKVFERKDWSCKGTGFSRADGSTILKVDLGNDDEIAKALNETKPQVVVHCAANRFPDKVDGDPEGTRALNVAASRSLARQCAARGALLLYISTDYVFSGRPGEAPYAADAPPGPTNLYGQTKLDGERAVLAEFRDGEDNGMGVVLRVPVLYGPAETRAESAVNVLVDVVEKAAAAAAGDGRKNKVKMDHWAVRYPTNTEDVARVCHDVAVRYLEAGKEGRAAAPPRVLQFSSEDRYTKYEMCEVFAEILGLPLDGVEANAAGNDPGASVQRPYDCHLSTRELREVGVDVSTQDFVGWWRRELRAFRH